jgi:hypothetical protein
MNSEIGVSNAYPIPGIEPYHPMGTRGRTLLDT